MVGGVRIGVAEVDYTPRVGLPLLGNLRKDYASKGVHDPLMAKAIVFADSAGTKAALMAMDICMLTRDQVAYMRGTIAGRCDIPVNHILIAATHLHSGPSTCQVYTMPKADDADIKAFLGTACEAVVLADADLSDADLKIGYAEERRISFYRRIECRDGRCRMNWEAIDSDEEVGPFGEIDPQVIALLVEVDGKPVACLVNFGLHPAILDYENELYSAEFPGVLAEEMRKTYGDGFVTLFLNGCCGNINHIERYGETEQRLGYEVVRHVGRSLAESVREALRAPVDLKADAVKASSRKVALKRMAISREKYEWSLEAVERLKTTSPEGSEDGLAPEYAAPTWIEMYEQQHEDDAAEVMALRIGGVGIVGLPGEAFSEYGQQVKAESRGEHTVVIELANDSIGYLPTPKAFDQGGYEVTPGATRYERDAGRQLAASAVELLNGLFDE